jgi:mannose/cellobiose epimerase-like protein (N-acyl-D-glucosamine 2-epimerase family)
MGTHLHTLEAMLAMNEALGDHRFWPRARQVADLIVERMVEPESKCGLEHFHADWTRNTDDPKRALINYGHNLEAAWMLLRVHRAEPNQGYRETARGFLDYVLRYGLDENYGGVYSHGPLNEPATLREKIWWVQCEALPAFLLGYLEFGEERYFDAFSQTLRFSLDHLHDPVFGEWYHSVEENGAPRDQSKGSAWKAAYHVTQALAYADGYLREVAGAGRGGQ